MANPLVDIFTDIGNAIRDKLGITSKIPVVDMAARISDIETGIDTDDATATRADILAGKTAYSHGNKITGIIGNARIGDPTITVDTDGTITASSTCTEGYVNGSRTVTATEKLNTVAATTYTPGTSNQTIAAQTFTTGVQTIAGDASLKESNIKKGVSIFGVTGTFEGEKATLFEGWFKESDFSLSTASGVLKIDMSDYIDSINSLQAFGMQMTFLDTGITVILLYQFMAPSSLLMYTSEDKTWTDIGFLYMSGDAYGNTKKDFSDYWGGDTSDIDFYDSWFVAYTN